jgi:hypothetical protein
MLSGAEILFFRGEKQVSDDYARKIRARAEAKIQRLRGELAILALDPKIGPILRNALEGALREPNIYQTESCPRTENCPSKTEELNGPGGIHTGMGSSLRPK